MISDPFFYLVATPAVIFLGLAKGGFAGVGTLATPLLALYVPPLEAAAILLPILIVQDAISVWTYRRDWDRWNVKVLMPGALIGMGLAWLLAAYVSDAAVRISVGLIGLSFVLHAWVGGAHRKPTSPTRSAALFWGTLCGFTSMLAQGGGPPYQVFVLPQRMPKLTLVGTTTIFFAIVNSLKIGPYFALGQFSSDGFGTSVVLLPLAVLANFLGIWLVRITPTDLFYRLTYILVFFISLGLLWQGIFPLLHR